MSPSMNPYPLGVYAPAAGAGSAVAVLSNVPTLDSAYNHAHALEIACPASNSQNLVVGITGVDPSTLANVLLIIAPGAREKLFVSEGSGNNLDLTKLFVATANTGDKAIGVGYWN